MSAVEDDTVTLVIEEKSLQFSKAELSSKSEYFRVMFTQEFAEKDKDTVFLQNVSLKSFLATVQIAKNDEQYTGIDYKELISILKTADEYMFMSVRNRCIKPLEQLMSLVNVFEVWQTAENVNAEKLLVKARYTAVTEFETVRYTAAFICLDSVFLFRYLANTTLLCDKEMNVFEAGMRWLACNPEETLDKEELLTYTLLTCLDYHSLSDSDIEKIQNHNLIKRCPNLPVILQIVLDATRKNTCYVYASDVIEKAKVLLNKKRRAKDGFPTFVYRVDSNSNADITSILQPCSFDFKSLCIAADYTQIFLSFDGNNVKWICGKDTAYVCSAQGQGIFGYKQFLFFCGGENRIGCEKWVKNIYVFDAIEKSFILKSKFPFVRRHFKLVICGKIAYFLGGFGNYRMSKNNKMFFYFYETDEWSCELPLPFCMKTERALCSNLNGELFLMVVTDVKNPKGYLFSEPTTTWKNIQIGINDDNPIQHLDAALFYYDSSLFLKSTNLTEFKLADDSLVEINSTVINGISEHFLVDYCLCNDTLYSLYESMSAEKENLLEVFSMETRTSTIVPVPNKPQCITSFRHYNICKTEEYINAYFRCDV